ncbi:hypothetical protein FA95DRAFT_400586 [Auriscalpium vulgare]|uniref:Uncharacterized protein n=1 Tax=Auriscalpium vulgare TaxID=40419 RepID=A0ACB8RI55_9AGAM|nr:hypothetical protein FA95DRAFT_400586 [Auriscalpium vulgare]
MIQGGQAAHAVFSKDVEDTYAHIARRVEATKQEIADFGDQEQSEAALRNYIYKTVEAARRVTRILSFEDLRRSHASEKAASLFSKAFYQRGEAERSMLALHVAKHTDAHRPSALPCRRHPRPLHWPFTISKPPGCKSHRG